MVSAREALRALTALLNEAGVEESSFEAGEIFKEYTGKHPLSAENITESELERMNAAVRRRAAGEPLQYIFGKWEFYGLPFYVGEGVLIPRPETELLAELAINECKNGGSVLDLCSGTGCIAAAIAKNTEATVYAAELYDGAFSYLEKNIAFNGVNVRAVKGDALDASLFGEVSFDMIVSNPPYLTRAETESLQREVRREPETALFGGEDGLDFYRVLIPRWKGRLKPGGSMAFETGDGQAEAVKLLFEKSGFSAEIIPDLQGIGRVVHGRPA